MRRSGAERGNALDPTSATVAGDAGGLVLAGFDATSAADAPLDFLCGLAGTILFARNLRSPEQAARLIADLQTEAARAGALPLVIAIDEEGGTVSRLATIGTTIPSAMALGAVDDLGTTQGAYRVVGDELAALGVTLDFAPVADVNSNRKNPVIGVRSFGDDARRVGDHVAAAIRGLHDSGVAAAAKHFPGHGAASVDSHKALPTIDRDATALGEVEYVPFRAAIAAGVDAIMTAHVSLPLVDASGTPATLSRPLLTGVLRGDLGFEGVICTDCLQMKAITGGSGAGDAAVAAVAAGADLVTFSSSIEGAREAVAALRAAVLDGHLSAMAVERSLARVRALRSRSPARRASGVSVVGAAAHRETALDVARKAVTLVRDPGSSVPLAVRAGQKIFVVQFDGGDATPVETTGRQTTHFGKLLARGPARVQEQIRTLDPAGHEYKQLLMAAGSADVIVAVTRRAWAHARQALAVADLALAGKPLVVVAAREPYDASVVPPDAAVIATYGDDEASMEAAAEVLLGTRIASGRLPVTLSDADAGAGAAAGARAGAAPSAGATS